MTEDLQYSSIDGEIWDTHPEVFHYTSRNGLRGILDSDRLFATHYQHLNDSSELQILRSELPAKLEPIIHEILIKDFRSSQKSKREIRKLGGVVKLRKSIAAEIADVYYRTAFDKIDNEPPFITPYITSFCGHTSDEPYVQKNGLLSQWRAYADEGFAIVIDTKKLWDLCLGEKDTYAYQIIHFSPAVYQGDDEAFRRECGPAIELIERNVKNLLRTGNMVHTTEDEPIAKIIPAFTSMKHIGFQEEREVRIVACPRDNETHAKLLRKHPDKTVDQPIKEFKQRPDGAPYIELFDFERSNLLPIKRVIVGPRRNQEDDIIEAKRIVGKRRIRVTCSETPFVQPARR